MCTNNLINAFEKQGVDEYEVARKSLLTEKASEDGKIEDYDDWQEWNQWTATQKAG